VLTPDAMHDKEKTKQVLESRGVREIEFTVRSLVDRKLISRIDHQNRPIPGRHYKMAEKCIPPPIFRKIIDLDGRMPCADL
jgi:hypothetical protein